MIRVVLDTSVLVPAVISPKGPNARLFDLIVAKGIRPYVTEAILEKYTKVFQYERLQASGQEADRTVPNVIGTNSGYC